MLGESHSMRTFNTINFFFLSFFKCMKYVVKFHYRIFVKVFFSSSLRVLKEFWVHFRCSSGAHKRTYNAIKTEKLNKIKTLNVFIPFDYNMLVIFVLKEAEKSFSHRWPSVFYETVTSRLLKLRKKCHRKSIKTVSLKPSLKFAPEILKRFLQTKKNEAYRL